MKLKAVTQSLLAEKYSMTWKLIFWANCGLLLFLTLSPDVYHRPTFTNVDKVYHFIGFAAFAGLLSLAFVRLKFWFVVAIGSSLGLFIEIAQHFIPFRGASVGDLAADILGVFFAASIVSGMKCWGSEPE